MGEPEGVDKLRNVRLRDLAAHDLRAHAQLLRHGAGDELVLGVLEDEADAISQLTGLPLQRRALEAAAHEVRHANLARLRRQQPGHRHHPRGLARTIRPGEHGGCTPRQAKAARRPEARDQIPTPQGSLAVLGDSPRFR